MTIALPPMESFAYHFVSIPSVQVYSANETTKGIQLWPRQFYPEETFCTKCSEVLTNPLKKTRRSGFARSSLIVSLEHIIGVDVYTKRCRKCFLGMV